jgi:outer membrane receptor protein involved in Fe transport
LAREATYQIDIPQGPLVSSIARLSAATGVSIGYSGDLPRVATRPVKGTMTADAALRKMLKGTPFRAVQARPGLYRLEREVDRRAMVQPAEQVPLAVGADIIVTAQKRQELLSNVPLSVAVVSFNDVSSRPTSSTSRDIASDTEGLTMTNLGPGRNRQFIRGVADSPFNGQSQTTVSVHVDDARVTFNAPDPDLRLIDVDRVEVLKGPQGALYGSGALGGIYHIVTHRPDLTEPAGWARLSAQGVEHGTVGTGGEAVVNMPLVEDRLAVRAVGYRFLDAGWINNLEGTKNSNSAETVGLRVDARWRPFDRWTVDVGYTLQDINSRDSQYVLASDDTLKRTSMMTEPTDNDFKLAHGTIQIDLGDVQFTSATSYVDHGLDYVLDATSAAGRFGLTGLTRFEDQRAYTLFNQEVRFSSTGARHWLVGASYLRATTHGGATLTDESGVPLSVETLDRVVREYAVFGEETFGLIGKIDATIGARLFHSIAEDETTEQQTGDAIRLGKTILSPSVALSMPTSGNGLLYLRYARAMRPGGLAPSGMTGSGRFDADELGTVDFGFRRRESGSVLGISASVYYTVWKEIQSDYLLPNGLIATQNAGRGEIVGMEAAVEWNFAAGLTIAVGGSAQRARLTHAENGLKLDDRRLPIAPDLTGRLALIGDFTMGSWGGKATAQVNYMGSARLTFDDDLDREMGHYAVAATNAELSRGPWTMGAGIDNLFDVKGDSFAFGNPFSIREGQQYTPLRPRTLTLSIAWRW